MAKKRANRPKQAAVAKEPQGSTSAQVAPPATAEEVKSPARTSAKAKPRARRRVAKKAAAKARAKRAASKKSPTKRSKLGMRYTPAQRAHILAVARKEGLTGDQVAKKFGVSALSYYTWRKKAGSGTRRGRKPGSKSRILKTGRVADGVVGIVEMIRQEVRARLAVLAPQVIQSEIGKLLGQR